MLELTFVSKFRKKWQNTLETIISTRDLPNSEKVLEFTVYELFDLFYAKEKKFEVRTEDFLIILIGYH